MDLYGLGAIIYEALTGHAPFSPDVPAAARTDPGALDDPAPDQPALGRLCRRLLSADPAPRPQTADDLLLELAAVHPPGGLWPGWADMALAGSTQGFVPSREGV